MNRLSKKIACFYFDYKTKTAEQYELHILPKKILIHPECLVAITNGD